MESYDLIVIGSGPAGEKGAARAAVHESIEQNLMEHGIRRYASTILNMRTLPEDLTVVGGGIVGCEFACLFQALGIPVTMVHGGARFFPFADREISERLQKGMESMGMRVHVFERVLSIEPDENDAMAVTLQSGETLHTRAVLCASGRQSNVERLHLENAGLRTGVDGLIHVDENYRTAVGNIYAAGDVIGFPALSSTSMEQGRAAVTHAFGFGYEKIKSMSRIPFGIWTIPEISMVGESEASLNEKRLEFINGPAIVGRADYKKNPRGMVLGEEHGLLKMVFAPDYLRLLGVHILGQEACELIALGLTGLETGMTAYDFVNLTFNFPSLADMYKYAAYDAIGEYRRRAGHRAS